MHAAGEHTADQNPQQTGQITELRSKHRTEQRTGSGNGGKVMTEQHELIGLDIVLTVSVLHSGGHAVGIHVEHLGCNKQAVETISDCKNAERCKDDRYGIDSVERRHESSFLLKNVFFVINGPRERPQKICLGNYGKILKQFMQTTCEIKTFDLVLTLVNA